MEVTRQIVFESPGITRVNECKIESPGPGEVQVQALCSAISAGTERLFFKGELEKGISADSSIAGLQHGTTYPISYGYCMVGRVVSLGEGVTEHLIDKRIFAFHPHHSRFNCQINDLFVLPEDISDEDALFYPFMETAFSFAMDGQPMIGERIGITGLGTVGLLTAYLLSQFPLDHLIGIDPLPKNRLWAQRMGVSQALSPDEWEAHCASLDAVFELSGSPEALATAIRLCAYSGRVLIGSWYAGREAAMPLGTHFHRNKIELISSQVSRIHPRWTGSWSSLRRREAVLQHLKACQPGCLITHQFSCENASQAYTTLCDPDQHALQIMFTY